MIPFVLGGIALAAVGYKVLKYCDEEGCSLDNKVSDTGKKDNSENGKNNKNSLHGNIFSDLEEVLRRVKGSSYSIDESFVFQKESHEDTILTCIMKEMGKEAYLCSCSNMLDKAYEISEFYTKSIERLLERDIDIKSVSKVEKKMLKYAFKFYNEIQTLLSQTLVDEEGTVTISSSKAFLLYEKVIAKHKMKISFFRSGIENYTLFFTAPENKVLNTA